MTTDKIAELDKVLGGSWSCQECEHAKDTGETYCWYHAQAQDAWDKAVLEREAETNPFLERLTELAGLTAEGRQERLFAELNRAMKGGCLECDVAGYRKEGWCGYHGEVAEAYLAQKAKEEQHELGS